MEGGLGFKLLPTRASGAHRPGIPHPAGPEVVKSLKPKPPSTLLAIKWQINSGTLRIQFHCLKTINLNWVSWFGSASLTFCRFFYLSSYYLSLVAGM